MLNFPLDRDHLGQKLSLKEWSKSFDKAWDKMKTEYFQYERLQNYQEPSNPSYLKFKDGNMNSAIEKLPDAVKVDISYYREMCRKSIPYVRIHSIENQLTDYLKWEIELYKLLCQFGQRILIADISSYSVYDDLFRSYDFLMFDSSIVMVQDYGNDGILCGGWIVENKSLVSYFVKLSQELLKISIPLGEFQSNRIF